MAKTKSMLLDDLTADQIQAAMKKKGTLLRICVQNGLSKPGSFPSSDSELKNLVLKAWEKIHGPIGQHMSQEQDPEPKSEEPKKKKGGRKKGSQKEEETTPKPNSSENIGSGVIDLTPILNRLTSLEEAVVRLSTTIESFSEDLASDMKAKSVMTQALDRLVEVVGPEFFTDILENDDDGNDDDDDDDDGDDGDGYEDD